MNYRKIKKTDKLPPLPKKAKLLFISNYNNYIYVFAIDKEKNYTMMWDGYSKSFNRIWWQKKDKYALYKEQRMKL